MSSAVTTITVAHRLQTIMDADKIVCSMYSLSPIFTEHEA
jgi:ABC-type transport system involved in Fe-S cluster assembly fused permease/ATPase subunit